MEPVTPRTTHFCFGSELICRKNSKHQAPSSREAPNSKLQTRTCALPLVFEVWGFSGAWCLVLGAFCSRHLQPPAQISLRPHDVAKLLQILLHRFADDGVTIIPPQFHFARGRNDAQLDLLRRFGSALGQPPP